MLQGGQRKIKEDIKELRKYFKTNSKILITKEITNLFFKHLLQDLCLDVNIMLAQMIENEKLKIENSFQ